MLQKIYAEAKKNERAVAGFLRELIAIKSLSSQEGNVIARIKLKRKCNRLMKN